MTANNANPFLAFMTTPAGSGPDTTKNGETKKDLWSSMLDSVASGKRLPEKNIIVLGGTVDSQREFLESLSTNENRRTHLSRMPPVANMFALGYTYYDVLDADQEDILARVSLYTLTSPSPAFASLLKPLLTPQSIPNTLIVILLDWSQPWKWLRQLREWILLLRTVLISLSNECKETMEEVMLSWRDRGRGSTNLDGTTAAPAPDSDVALPIGPGEWEDALGLPLCLVCQNAEKMEYLEKTQGWREEEFDVVLQFLRTILLRHGASLIYTTPSTPSQLPSLIHASLGVHSLLKKHPLKHNVIDRDKIVVPPNWDSWGKIRVLRDGFEVETVSNGWTIDLDQTLSQPSSPTESSYNPSADLEGSAVTLFESAVQDPTMDALQIAGRTSHSTDLEVETTETQTFLAQQLKVLETYRQKNEEASREEGAARGRNGVNKKHDDEDYALYNGRPPEPRVMEHIGPVQFNMGGIQVDADDMVQRLKERQTYVPSDPPTPNDDGVIEDAPPMDTENLQAFFTGLMNRRAPTK